MKRLFLFLLLGVAALSLSADPFPPYWQGGAGASIHYQPVSWPAAGDWVPYSFISNNIEDPATSDPSNGGTSPQNYVNVSSGCTDQTLPSVYYYYDSASDTLYFRWRVGQIANTYATGPSPGSFRSTDPWKSALWTVLIDIDGDGFREFAVHLNGSSGEPGREIDLIQSIYSDTPSQSIDYINDPSIFRVAHNPTAFVDQASSRILNFQSSLNPSISWPNGSAETVWDYGTTRASLIGGACEEYFIDYQIPVGMLDASAVGGPTLTADTPFSFAFATANSLNNPLQKDIVFNGAFTADPDSPVPGGDVVIPSGGTVPQPVVRSISTAGCGPVTLTTEVLDALNPDGTTTVVDVDFYYYADSDGNGVDDDGGSWTFAAQASTNNSPAGRWTASWNSSGLLQGSYLIGVRAEDAQGNITYSYYDQAEVNANVGSTPPNYPNPSAYGEVTAPFSNSCGLAPPSLTKSSNVSETTVGGTVTFTLTVTNTTSSPISISSIQDQLPTGFTYVSTSGSSTLTPTSSPTAGDSGLITWTFSESIPASSTRTLIFDTTAGTVTGTYSNSATASTSYAQLDSNAVSIGVGAPRLTIQKSASSASVNPGDSVTYTITYSNDSPVDVTNAVITDVVPDGLTFVSATGGGSYDGGTRTVTWPIGSLNSGEGPFSVSFTATVDNPFPDSAAIPVVNTATIDSDESAPASGTSSIFVNAPRPSMQIQKDGPPIVSAGNQATFTISYANSGNATANGVTITDVIPAGWTFVSASGSNTNPGLGNNGTVTWTIGSVAAGSSGSVTLTLQASNPYTGADPVTNTATLDYTGAPSSVSDDYTTAISSAGGSASCFTPISGSDTSDSSFTLSNVTANDGVRDAYIANDSATTYNQAIYQQYNFASNLVAAGSSVSDATLTFDFLEKNLDGAKLEFYVGGAFVFQQTIDPTVSQNQDITVVVDLDANGIDTAAELNDLFVRFLAHGTGNNSSRTQATDFVQLCVTTTPPADVVANKQVSSLVAQAGDTLTYTIEFANGGGSPATGAQVVDTLPAGVTYQSALLNGVATSPSSSSGQQYTFNVNTSGAAVGTLAAGGTGTLSITVGVNNPLSPVVQELTNAITLSNAQTADVTDSITTGIVAPSLGITKSASPTLLTPGDTATYTITVLNSGDGSATSVQVTDVLPETGYYTYVASSTTLNGATVTPDPYAGGTLTIDVGTLGAGSTATITYQMTVAGAGAPDGVTDHQNAADVTAGNVTGTITSDPVTVSTTTNPLLSVAKSSTPAAGPVAAGDTLSYSITVSNSGSSTALNVTLTDPIPSGTSYSPGTIRLNGTGLTDAADADAARFDAGSNAVIVEIGGLASGATATIDFEVVTDSPAPAGTTTVTNNVTVTSSNASSRSDSSSISVTAAPVLSVDKRAPGEVAFPLASLTANASASTTIQVDDARLVRIGERISINGTEATVTGVSGTTVTLDTAVSGTNGDDVDPVLEYVISVENTGSADATNMTVSDPLPAGIVYSSASPAPTSAPTPGTNGTVTWTGETLPVGSTALYRIFAVPTAAGSYSNTATVTADSATPADDTETTDVGVLVPSKTTSTPTVTNTPSGATATYTIVVENQAAVTATNVIVTDTLPSGFTYGGSLVKGGTATQTTVNDPAIGETVPEFGNYSIPAGGNLTLTFDASISSGATPATYQNAISVSSDNVAALVFDFLATTSEDVTVSPAPTISINDVTVTEGDVGTVTATFTVSLSASSTSTVTADYATADGTASSLTDYSSATGTVTFAPGVISQTISVTVNSDLIDESNETFFVNLSNASGATFADDQGLGTITDDDGAPTISINDVTVAEGDSGSTPATFTLTLSNPSASAVTVDFVTADGTAISGADYTASTGTVTFAPGITSQTVTIDVLGDLIDEPSEQFEVVLSNPSNATINDGTGVGTITDNDGSPSISIDDVTVSEGDSGSTPATFTLTLSNPSSSTITIDYTTVSGTATAGADFTAESGTVTFAPGITSRTITIDVLGDLIDESNEQFTVTLSNPTNATIADGTGVGTITDNDGAPTISIDDVTVNEGDSGTTPAHFTVTLSNPSSSTITVDYGTMSGTATSGIDFNTTSGTVTFAPGITSRTVTVDVIGDLIDESNEQYTVNLSNPSNATIADGTGVGTITDDDGTPTISIDDVSVTEGDSGTTPALFTLTLSNPSASTITVDFGTTGGTATAGTDFIGATGTVTFAPGSTSQTITIDVAGDLIDESNEQYTVNLSNPSNATIADGTGVGTILDDDGTPTITIDDVTVTEGDAGTTPALFTLTLSNPSSSTITVDYGTTGGTATSGTDFTAATGTVTFAPGSTSQTISIDVLGDVVDESDEQYTVNLSNPSNATIADGTGVGTILDDDGTPTVSIDDVTVAEGDAGTTPATFTVTLSNPSSSTITVDYGTTGGTATAGTDFTGSTGTVTFNPGETSQTVTIDVLGDVVDESNEQYTVNLSSPSNATLADPTGLGTITDDDGTPTITIDDVTVTEGDTGTTPATFTVTLSNPSSSTITVDYGTTGGTATAGSDFTATSGTVTFSPGVTSQTVTIDVLADGVDESDEQFTVILSNPSNATISDGTGVGTILDDDGAPTISINDVTVTEGDAGTTPATFTVSLSNPSAATVTVDYGTTAGTATAGSDFTTATGTVTFNPGETSKTVTISVLGDLIDESDEQFTVTLSSPTNATILDGTGVGTILDDDGAPTISINDVTVTEGDSGTTPATFTVALSNPSASTITVDYATTGGTATSGADFNAATGTVTFSPGVTSQTVTIDVIGDLIDESDEQYSVVLSSPSNATIADGTGLGTITDDDGAPTISINDVTVVEGDSGTTPATFTVSLSNPSASTITVDFGTTGGTATSGTDFTAVTGTVTFNPGITTRTVTIDVLGDLIDESDEQYTVNLSNPSNATLADATGLGTITDDDGTPTITIDDVTVSEGDSGTTPATFTVTLSNPSASTVTVDFGTTGGTATSGTDFTAATGTVTFNPGETSKTLTIDVTGDLIDESDEQYTVNLSNPSNATIADGTGLGTITDDDGAPSVLVGDASVSEGGNLLFQVSLSNPSASTINLQIDTSSGTATDGTDYTSGPYTVDFAPGETVKTVSIPTTPDTIDESDETMTVSVTPLSGGVGDTSDTGSGTILDDDGAPSVQIADASASEGDTLQFQVTLSNPSAFGITLTLDDVGVTASSGSDYDAGPYVVTFLAGETSKTLNINSIEDLIDESDETFTLAVTGSSGGAVGDTSDTGTGTIQDDDGAPSVTIGDASVTEGGFLAFPVSLSNPSASTITLTIDDVGVTATSGTDYGAGPYTVTFNPGETSATLNIPTIEDTIAESDETMTLSVTGTTGPVGDVSDTGTGTIVDDDAAPSVAISDASIGEGGVLSFAVTLSNPSSTPITLTIDDSAVTATSGTDYTSGPYTVTFNPGETSQTLLVPTTADSIDESDETFTLAVTGVAGDVGDTTDTGTGTIIDDDGAPSVFIGDATATEGSNLAFEISLSNPSSTTLTLTLGTNDVTATGGVDYTGGPYSVTFSPGETVRTVTVPSLPDAIDESDETMTLLVQSVDSGTAGDTSDTGTGTIIDDDGAPSVLISDASVTEGGDLIFTVDLSNPSAGNLTLRLSDNEITATSGTDYPGGPYDVTIPAGSTSETVTISTISDLVDESNETFELVVSSVLSGSAGDTSDTGTGTIVDDDGAPSVDISDATVSEGGNLDFTITLSNPSATTITLTIQDSGVTATSGTDYTSGPYTVTFLPGETVQTLSVPTLADVIDEDDETMQLSIIGTSGGVGDFSDTGTGTITDDDAAPSVLIGDVSVIEGSNLAFEVSLSNPSSSTITLTLDDVPGTAAATADYTAGPYSVSFAPGETVKTVLVPTVNDTIDEADETFDLQVISVDAGTVGDTSDTGRGTILDDDGAPSVFVGDAVVSEGGTLIFEISLSNPSAGALTLELDDQEVSASAVLDYADGPYSVTFAPGETVRTIAINTVSDSIDETDETMTLVVTGVTTGTAGDTSDTGTGTIIDDDGAPSVFISDAMATEGGTLQFEVSLSNPAATDLTLRIDDAEVTATSGTDYTGGPYTVTFAAGETLKTINVSALQDAIDESDETFTLFVDAVVSGSAGDTSDTGTGTIVDDDGAPSLLIGDATVTEGGDLLFDVTLSNPAATAIEVELDDVQVTATAGTDYSAGSYLVRFEPGETAKTLVVSTISDVIDESDETFRLGYSSTISGTLGDTTDDGIGTIIDDDSAPSVTIGDAAVAEGGVLTFQVTLSNPSTQRIVLALEESDLNASSGLDYDSGPYLVTFEPGETVATLNIATIEDTIDESDESFVLSVVSVNEGAVGDATDTGVGTITDDDAAPSITIGDATTTEGGDLLFDVRLSNASTGDITLTLDDNSGTAASGVDYQSGPYSLTIPAGTISGTLSVPSTQDAIDEADEQFTILITGATGDVGDISDTGTGTIIDDDGAPSVLIGDATTIEGGDLVFDVTLSNASATPITLTLTDQQLTATSGSDYQAGPYTVTFAPGETTATVTVSSLDDAITESDESFRLVVSSFIGDVGDTSDTGTGTILDDDSASSADLSLVKDDGGAGFVPGGQIRYDLTVSNLGPDASQTVAVTDTPDAALTLASFSGSGWSCTASASTVDCTLALLAAGQVSSLTLVFDVDPGTTAATISNSASVGAVTPDPDPSNNDSTDTTPVITTATPVDIAITKDVVAANPLFVGDTFDFVLTIENVGTTSATNVVVTDDLPPSFTLQNIASTRGFCSGSTTVTCSLGDFVPGDTATITLTGSPNAPGEMINTAEVVADEIEAVTANNASAASVTVISAAGAAAIPTASEWMMILMALGLALIGLRRVM